VNVAAWEVGSQKLAVEVGGPLPPEAASLTVGRRRLLLDWVFGFAADGAEPTAGEEMFRKPADNFFSSWAARRR